MASDTPTAALARARTVADAMHKLFEEAASAGNLDEAKAWDAVLRYASPTALAKLGRMVK